MIQIKEWMSHPVISVNPDETLYSAAKKMVKHDIGCLIVTDKKRKIYGIMTERDILKKAVGIHLDTKKIKVKDVMTKNVKKVSINSTVLKILKIMDKGKFRDIPITKDVS